MGIDLGDTSLRTEGDMRTEKEPPSDFEETIAATGYGKFNICLMLCTLPAFWSSVAVTSSVSYIFTRAQCDMDLTLLGMGTVASMTYGGMITSAMMWGFLSDTLGRKRIMVWGFFATGLVEIVAALSQNFAMLLVMRFASGFFHSLLERVFVGDGTGSDLHGAHLSVPAREPQVPHVERQERRSHVRVPENLRPQLGQTSRRISGEMSGRREERRARSWSGSTSWGVCTVDTPVQASSRPVAGAGLPHPLGRHVRVEHAAAVVPAAGGHDRHGPRRQPVRRGGAQRRPRAPFGRRGALRAPPHGHAHLPAELRGRRGLRAHLRHRERSHQQVRQEAGGRLLRRGERGDDPAAAVAGRGRAGGRGHGHHGARLHRALRGLALQHRGRPVPHLAQGDGDGDVPDVRAPGHHLGHGGLPGADAVRLLPALRHHRHSALRLRDHVLSSAKYNVKKIGIIIMFGISEHHGSLCKYPLQNVRGKRT